MNKKEMQTLIKQVEALRLEIQTLTSVTETENVMIDIAKLQKSVFPQWKRQTIYNKCNQSEIPHYKIEGKLMFNLQECLQWRNEQIRHRAIKITPEQRAEILTYKAKVVIFVFHKTAA
jgi:hypothetical protein